jgi:hypothetical protein
MVAMVELAFGNRLRAQAGKAPLPVSGAAAQKIQQEQHRDRDPEQPQQDPTDAAAGVRS